MEEAAVRELLITECRRLLAGYEARQSRPWYGQPPQWFDFSYVEETEFSKEWPDYNLLAGAMSYMDGFADSMNHGFAHFDSRTWEEAVSELRELTARLEISRQRIDRPSKTRLAQECAKLDPAEEQAMANEGMKTLGA